MKIRILNWIDAKVDAEAIRRRVFIEEQAVPEDMEWDEFDEISQHALCYTSDNHAVGYARLLPNHYLGRMAVLPEYRQQGIGSLLLKNLESVARSENFGHIILHAQIQALPS